MIDAPGSVAANPADILEQGCGVHLYSPLTNPHLIRQAILVLLSGCACLPGMRGQLALTLGRGG
jgi:hypothetical protein